MSNLVICLDKNFKFAILFLIVTIFLAGCEKRIISDEEIWLETKDNLKIRASTGYSEGEKAVILAHMLDHNRNDWKYFAKKLNTFGISTIAIDLRGHGESEGNWRKFSDADFNNMVYDIEAAKLKLEKEGKKNIGIIGASIGANAALKYAANDKGIKAVVLLSPGINYKGVDVSNDITDFNTPALIAVSKEDAYSFESSDIINENISGEKQLFVGENLGHGTDMLPKSEEMQNNIITFLDNNLK